jgi:hypothetical protein
LQIQETLAETTVSSILMLVMGCDGVILSAVLQIVLLGEAICGDVYTVQYI